MALVSPENAPWYLAAAEKGAALLRQVSDVSVSEPARVAEPDFTGVWHKAPSHRVAEAVGPLCTGQRTETRSEADSVGHALRVW